MSDEARPKSFWIFDENRRVYARDERGRSTGGPIWIEHWREQEVTGETRVSWIVGGGWSERKIPKRGPWPMRGVCRSREEVEARAWVEETRAAIYREAHSLTSMPFQKIVALARALGFEVPPHVEKAAAEYGKEG